MRRWDALGMLLFFLFQLECRKHFVGEPTLAFELSNGQSSAELKTRPKIRL